VGFDADEECKGSLVHELEGSIGDGAIESEVESNSKRHTSPCWKIWPTCPTWNVDFMMNNVTKRLTAALDHLQYHAFLGSEGGQPPPCVILLQEIHVRQFGLLLAHPWVREWFMVAPGSTETGWPRYANYGTVTLVSWSSSMLLAGSTCIHFGNS